MLTVWKLNPHSSRRSAVNHSTSALCMDVWAHNEIRDEDNLDASHS
jgi:hypothetical protein